MYIKEVNLINNYLQNIFYFCGEDNMKSNAKSKTIILFTLGILLAFSPIINNNFNFNRGNIVDFTLDKNNLKISAVSGKIHINGNSEWLSFKNDGSCSGEGTYSNPYVIEDLVIDGSGSVRCIWIENSNIYFEIKNCILFKAINCGIRLSNVLNGRLINNNCSFNEGRGMDIRSTHDTEIINNSVSNNGGGGIAVQSSQNITVSLNSVNGNHIGMLIYNNQNCTISRNNILSNTDEGILIDRCSNLKLSNNEISLNRNGMNLGAFGDKNVDNCTISANVISDNVASGISLIGVTNQIISGNIVNGNTVGIFLGECYANILLDNTANDNDWAGIVLRYSNYTTISGNTASNNNYYGMVLEDSNYNNISGNTANYNHYGICLNGTINGGSDYNIVSGNTLIGNDICFVEDNCEGNIFENNDCGISFEMILLISIISGGAMVGVVTILLIRHKRKRIT